MTIIFLIISLGLLGLALYLAGDFLRWRAQGRIIKGTIKDFQGKKDKGLRLPVVTFEDEAGKTQEASVKRIDQLLFLLNRPGAGDPTTVIYKTERPQEARIYGFINLLAALVLSIPLFVVLALWVANDEALMQIAYAVILGAMVIGGWVLLKFIQRYY